MYFRQLYPSEVKSTVSFGDLDPATVEQLEDYSNPSSFWHWCQHIRCSDCWEGVNEALALVSDSDAADAEELAALSDISPVSQQDLEEASGKDPAISKILFLLTFGTLVSLLQSQIWRQTCESTGMCVATSIQILPGAPFSAEAGQSFHHRFAARCSLRSTPLTRAPRV